jgi:glycolate oxidase FAD binding subunit
VNPATATPESVRELRDAVRDHAGVVALAGAGTAADWAGTPAPADVTVSTAGLTGIVAHNPGDMTVEVRAGTPLAALQEALARHGQRVAFDAARVGRGATVGGLFATADSGPLTLSYGSLRDLVIGATVVLADGTAARSGGHVIKNVAGYDLTKLLHGAQGTLGAVAELVLRLHPVPQAVRTVAVDVAADGVDAAARRVLESPVEVSALQWLAAPDSFGGGGRLLARLEGTTGAVEGRAGRLAEALGVGVAQLSPDDADAAWAAHDAAVDSHPDDGAVLRVGALPTRLSGLLAALDGEVGLRSVTTSPATGVATLTVPATTDAVDAVHERFAAAGGTSTLRHRPAGVELPAFGPAPSSVALLRAVAATLDPDQRFGRGRLAAWVPLPATTTTGASA